MSKKGLIISVFSILLVGVVLFLIFSGSTGYKEAYENTDKLKSYTMEISTIATMTDSEGTKQSVVDQVVKVQNKGKNSMIYSVESKANSYDSLSGETVNEENGYIYCNGFYYYDYPGVKYKGPADFEAANLNITNLSRVISFPFEKINLYFGVNHEKHLSRLCNKVS